MLIRSLWQASVSGYRASTLPNPSNSAEKQQATAIRAVKRRQTRSGSVSARARSHAILTDVIATNERLVFATRQTERT